MGNIRNFRWTATIAAGATTATAYSPTIRGKILKIGVDYNTAACTVDIDTDGETNAQKILDLASANTDATYYPMVALQDNTGTALDLSDTEGGDVAMYGYFVVYGRIKLSLASGTATHSVTVHVTVEE
jgi:hypothetical protein